MIRKKKKKSFPKETNKSIPKETTLPKDRFSWLKITDVGGEEKMICKVFSGQEVQAYA